MKRTELMARAGGEQGVCREPGVGTDAEMGPSSPAATGRYRPLPGVLAIVRGWTARKARRARRGFGAGRCQNGMDCYEKTQPETHLLRVQAAFLQSGG